MSGLADGIALAIIVISCAVVASVVIGIIHRDRGEP